MAKFEVLRELTDGTTKVRYEDGTTARLLTKDIVASHEVMDTVEELIPVMPVDVVENFEEESDDNSNDY